MGLHAVRVHAGDVLVDAEDVDEDARRANGQAVVITEPGRETSNQTLVTEKTDATLHGIGRNSTGKGPFVQSQLCLD